MTKKPLKFNNAHVVLAVCLLMVAATIIYVNNRSDDTTAQPKPYSATMSLSPATGKVGKGKVLKVSIYEDSGTQTVNAVQANLTYDATKFQFVNVDGTGSAFSIDAQSKAGSGKITIARGQLTPVKGKQFVAAINFKSLASSGKTTVNFIAGSALVRSTDNKNILTMSYGGNYSLTK